MKTIATAILMGIGLAMGILEMQVEQPDGVVLTIAGLLFGIGLHWYRVGLSFKTILVAGLLAVAFPLAAAAVVMGESLLGLLAFVTGGPALRMAWKGKKVDK